MAPGPAPSRRLGRSAGGKKRQRVVLKLQYISDREGKLLWACKWVTLAVALGYLIWGLRTKLRDDGNFWMNNNSLQAATVPAASLCVAAALGTLLLLARRLWWCAAHGKRWAPRQRLVVGFTALSLFLQLCSVAFWLTNMAYTWARQCSWFHKAVDWMGGLQWTVFNLIFALNTIQAAQLLPTGAWQSLFEGLRLRLPGMHRSQSSGSEDHMDSKGSDSGSECKGSVGDSEAAAAGGGASENPHGWAAEQMAAFTGATADLAASLKEVLVHWGVRLCILLFFFVPTQIIISLLLHQVLSDGDGEWDGFSCDPTRNGANTLDFSCFPAGEYSCDDITNWECYPSCTQWDWDCAPGSRVAALTWALGGLMTGAALVFLLMMWLALRQLGRRPYCEYRVQNLAARLALRTRVPTYVMFVLSMICLWYVKLDECNSYLQTWLGLPPFQIMMTATCVLEMLMLMPSADPDQASMLLHDSLQQFAWTEREATPMLEERGLEEEPLFCFETALKAAYYSLHVYRHFNPASTVTSIANALALSRCQHYEWLREPGHDSNCLLMWGKHSLVIAFRGTASVKNIKADLKAWRTAHQPRRGSFWTGSMPLVHSGFMQSWEADGFNQRVLGRIREILEGKAHADMAHLDCTLDGCCGHVNQEAKAALIGAAVAAAAKATAKAAGKKPADGDAEAQAAGATAAAAAAAAAAGDVEAGHGSTVAADLSCQAQPFRILLAGHSLGGAMTHLCGIDLARALPEWGFRQAPAWLPLDEEREQGRLPAVSISTYTFGAPRTGNHAYARDYGQAVPDCFSIINGQDAVANQAKFLVLFKRPGKPVLLSRRGDLIVRPSTIEHTAHRTSGTSLKQHMLAGSYCPSMASVLRAQVSGKPMPGGAEALAHLGEDEAMAELLERMLGLHPDGSSVGGLPGRPSPSAASFSQVLAEQQPSGTVG